MTVNRLIKGLNNSTQTENGAEAFKSSLNANLDYYATVAAARNRDTISLFKAAYSEDRQLALRNLFHLRDVRGGKGERDSFRKHLAWLYGNDRSAFYAMVPHVPFYGRWDDITSYVADPVVVEFVRAQFQNDARSKTPSLLAKWMPSENASSKATKTLARAWAQALELELPIYRRNLSQLRKTLRIVERSMSAQEWNEIEYKRVPSNAMKQYRKAFGKHDAEGFAAYLKAVEKGETKINAGTLFPYEIFMGLWNKQPDSVLEAQWKALPQYLGDKKFLVCPDVSGSMYSGQVPNIPPIAMSVSLAIYVSQFATGAFKDQIISFDSNPMFYDLSGIKTVYEKIRKVMSCSGLSTDLEKLFLTLLATAKRYKVPQSDMPDYLLVISDMQFNSCFGNPRQTLYDRFRELFVQAGYVAPTLVYWNVNSKENQVGMLDTAQNAIMVSGASAHVLKSALAGNSTTPVDAMLETLNSDRYATIIV